MARAPGPATSARSWTHGRCVGRCVGRTAPVGARRCARPILGRRAVRPAGTAVGGPEPSDRRGPPVHVVVVNRHPSVALGGSETQCALITAGLARRGHRVTWVAPGGGSSAASDVALVPVDDEGRSIVAAIAAAAPDVVYWRAGTRHLAHAVPRLRRRGIPVVFAASHIKDLRRFATAPSARANPVLRALEVVRDRSRSALDHRGLLRADALVVNNASHLGLVPIARQVCIPNGTERASRPFRWPRPYVAWVANLKPAKRPEACIDLARAIADLDVDVIMAGRIVTESYRRFEDAGTLPANLHFLGPVEPVDANGILSGARCHVHTCRPEGFSNVLIQAWSAGVPSVSLGFDPEGSIERERLGAVCGDDPGRFADEVRRMLTDDARRDAAGARASRFALTRFDTERNIDALEAFLGEVLASRETGRADGADAAPTPGPTG